MHRLLTLFLLSVFAGCTNLSGAEAIERIRIATTQCYGSCPAFEIIVSKDGSGRFDGEAFVKKTGRHSFRATSMQFMALRDRLEPFRPKSDERYDEGNCDAPLATDNPSIAITWYFADDEKVTLDWYLGCHHPELRDNTEIIYDAWEELPLHDLVGSEDERDGYNAG